MRKSSGDLSFDDGALGLGQRYVEVMNSFAVDLISLTNESELAWYVAREVVQKLGFADDLRDFEVAAQMLHTLKADRIRLLTNNPNKVQQLEQYKVDVTEMVTTGAFISAGNHSYLKAKVLKANHQIKVPSTE